VRLAQYLACLLLLGGCASAFPADAMRSVDRSVTVPVLRENPPAYLGRRVIVGGDILATRPMPGATEIELLTKPLDGEDRPRPGDASPGRVIVSTPQFLDPAVYAEGRRITVIGTVTGQEERKIGELPYRYPVLGAVDIRLWPREIAVAPYPAPWPYYYSPWPYPYWRYRGWGPWPFWW
jgi:outer membrane lipoprotein